MNIKTLIFRIAAFLTIINAQEVYTKESQDDNNSSKNVIIADHNSTSQDDLQYDEEMLNFIEETFQSVKDQTQKIEPLPHPRLRADTLSRKGLK